MDHFRGDEIEALRAVLLLAGELLRIRDLTQSDEMNLTQEFLAQMLGVRRTSVSLVANTLQKADFIKYRRGHIKIVDAEKLKSGACECYEKVKQRYETLIMPQV